MAARRDISLDLSGFADWCAAAGHTLGDIDFRPAFKQAVRVLISHTQQNFHRGQSPDGVPWAPLRGPRAAGRSGEKPLRDTDVLMASMAGRASGNVEEIDRDQLVWGTNVPYAAIHQEGAIIRPRRGRALSIPLTSEARRAGGASDFPRDLFLLRRSGKPPLLAESQNGQVVAHYVLLPSVRIPARPFLGINAEMADELSELFAEYVADRIGV